MPYYARHMSLAAHIEHLSTFKDRGFAPSRFRNHMSQLAKSEEFDNMMVLRFVIEAEILDASKKLEQSTDTLIATLKKHEAQR